MAKPEVGSASYLNKQMKIRGLQKLKFYCQLCEKQCRDDNGFKLHIKSPHHLKKISTVTKKDIEGFSKSFEESFLKLLRNNHGEKKISANKFYNEFIQDKHHIHMNATEFTSLNKFLQHLSKTGKIRVHGIDELATNSDRIDLGQAMISYIDNSYETLLRKERLDELIQNKKLEQNLAQKVLMKQIAEGIDNAKSGEDTQESTETIISNEDQDTNMECVPITFNIKTKKVNKPKTKKSKKNVFGKK
ncbi:hypothetical protein TPHA_0J01530 [Tetrapisispora phaffii CBS 4417]|uniref:C2H2-type domain-containing protein n=1 Tax=Tetrapisispora phaffii (strain ATCC 24235 / CBS 4417 / NBRC 1672 / NRRL Y-8282 / UCD 70-5) TaxID=1071381 RepID=G8BYN2_TETPH|nr:hypothetical protein TPHA_0J01530 [Tetrapisispora phaffii CBS 4417]CCE64974.1 hypothetical protein TPHA_0J01530 [Tetrapisispora phaffii CBS 4417]